MNKKVFCKTTLLVWIVITIMLFVFLVFNYINSLDIIKYRIDVYTPDDLVVFNYQEIKFAVESFKFISSVSILYVSLTGLVLYSYNRPRQQV